MRMLVLDKLGWPIERVRGRPISNAIRTLIYGRRIVSRARWEERMRKLEATRQASNNACQSPTPEGAEG